MYWQILGAILSAYLIRWLFIAAIQTYYIQLTQSKKLKWIFGFAGGLIGGLIAFYLVQFSNIHL